MLAAQLQLVNEQVLETDRLIRTNARSTEVGRRLMEIPGVGPLLASDLVVKQTGNFALVSLYSATESSRARFGTWALR